MTSKALKNQNLTRARGCTCERPCGSTQQHVAKLLGVPAHLLTPSSACAREPWCVLQVGHAGECSPEVKP